MRILFLSTNLPVPTTSGQAIRTLSLIRALAEAGHEIKLLAFVAPPVPEDLEPLPRWCRSIDLVPRPFASMAQSPAYSRRLAALLSGKSYGIERFRSPKMQELIASSLKSERFDLIWADAVYTLINLPAGGPPIVLNCHNVESLLLQRYALAQHNPLKRCYGSAEARWMRRAEYLSGRRSIGVAACSEFDADTFRAICPEAHVFIIPNCVDTDAFSLNPDDESGGAATLVFQGAMDWYPNQEAVEYFVEEILPGIRQKCADARLVVAGRNPSKQLLDRFGGVPGVEFTGTVPDIRPYLQKATVVVVPLRTGSGTRLKILEAAAAGKTVVSTSRGAEGLALPPDREIVLADTTDAFVAAVTRLLRDPDSRRALGQAARAKVIDRYSHIALQTIVNDFLSAIMREQRGMPAAER